MGFAKLDECIVDSSIWAEPPETRVVWITLLAKSDANGFVACSLSGLQRASNVSMEATKQAVAILESPDPDSRTPEHEGRRIEKVEGGWLILNYRAYRAKEHSEQRRRYMADYMRQRRVNSGELTEVNKELTGVNLYASASASDTGDSKEGGPRIDPPPPATDASRPTLAEVKAYAIDPHCGFRPDRVEEWFHDQCATEWRYAANWRAALKRDSLKERWRKPAFTATRKGPNI